MRRFVFAAMFGAMFLAVGSSSMQGQGKTEEFKGEITAAKKKITYKIQLKAESVYTIDLKSNAFDAFLEIRDTKGNLLAKDDDGGEKRNSRLTFVTGKKATFHIVARPLFAGQGPFTLSLTRRKVEFVAKGTLAKTDPRDKVRTKSHCKVHVVKLAAGTTYTIDLTAKFDTYLRVEDAGGGRLAHDDDGGESLNSRLNFRPTKTGNYRIIATAFDEEDLGPYLLTIQKK